MRYFFFWYLKIYFQSNLLVCFIEIFSTFIGWFCFVHIFSVQKWDIFILCFIITLFCQNSLSGKFPFRWFLFWSLGPTNCELNKLSLISSIRFIIQHLIFWLTALESCLQAWGAQTTRDTTYSHFTFHSARLLLLKGIKRNNNNNKSRHAFLGNRRYYPMKRATTQTEKCRSV